MKFSEAMLKGFEKVKGRQCANRLAKDAEGNGDYGSRNPHSVCAMGAVLLGMRGVVQWDYTGNDRPIEAARTKFLEEYGMDVADVNNEGMPWEHIYGMAVAAGL